VANDGVLQLVLDVLRSTSYPDLESLEQEIDLLISCIIAGQSLFSQQLITGIHTRRLCQVNGTAQITFSPAKNAH